MKIALIQQEATQDKQHNLTRGLEAARRAVGEGAEVIGFAELAFEPFYPQRPASGEVKELAEPVPGPITESFQKLAAELGVVVVLNLFERDGEETFDTSPVIDSDGTLLGSTRMVHITEYDCFHEQGYYTAGDRGAPVYSTRAGKIGVAICYDRHYPEYMRALGLKGAELVVIPQAGAVDEWPPGLFEAEAQVASLQNGYFVALANRVGEEECLTFAGESFVTDPRGQVIARAPMGAEAVLYADLDQRLLSDCPARKHYLVDRRPEIYPL